MNENLIPISQRSAEEVRAMQVKGGINSGKTRRRKREMRQLAHEILDTVINDEEIAEKLRAAGIEDTYGGLLLFKAIQGAQKNPAMFEKVMTLAGYDLRSNAATVDDTPKELNVHFVTPEGKQ